MWRLYLGYPLTCCSALIEYTQQGGRHYGAILYICEDVDLFGVSPTHSCLLNVSLPVVTVLLLVWKIDTGREIECFGIGIAVLPW